MSRTSTWTHTETSEAVVDVQPDVLITAPLTVWKEVSSAESVSVTRDATVEPDAPVDASHVGSLSMRWVPLVVPLLAAALACGIYFIWWAELASHG